MGAESCYALLFIAIIRKFKNNFKGIAKTIWGTASKIISSIAEFSSRQCKQAEAAVPFHHILTYLMHKNRFCIH